MSWFSVYGTGATLHGIDRTPEGRVKFTVWLSVFWMPLIPISSWSAVYAGESTEWSPDETHCFIDLVRVPHDWRRLGRTFGGAILVVFAALAPTAVMIERTDGRAATTFEMILVLAFVGWAAGLILYFEYRRRKRLRGGQSHDPLTPTLQ